MRQGEVINRVMRTRNYEQFKNLLGNRQDAKMRGKKIAQSIKENGYIFNPIVVNENYEVIDGQGRLCALQQLKLPVDYIVVSGLKVKDCITLNIYQKPWSLMDYVKSYAEMGNENYMRLNALVSKYSGSIPYTVVIAAATQLFGSGVYQMTSVKNGNLVIDELTYIQTQERLEYVMKFVDTLNAAAKGNKTIAMRAIIFAFDRPDVDKDRLVESVKRLYASKVAAPFIDMDGALKALSACYNFRARDRINLDIAYDEFNRSRIKGYEKRWSKHTD